MGWLEGLFHGIQATLFAQQMAARAQLEEMRQRGLPPGGEGRPPARHLPVDPRTGERSHRAPDAATAGSESRRCSSSTACGQARGTWREVLHPPAHPHRVLDARRRGPGRRPGRRGGRPTVSRRSGSPTTATCTGSSTSTRRAGTQGITPIIGTEAYMAGESRHERPVRRGRSTTPAATSTAGEKLYYHLTLLAETTEGYRNLMKLSSAAYLEGYYYKPRVDWELLERYHDGAHRHHRLPRRGRAPGPAAGTTWTRPTTLAGRLQDIFGRDNLFVELQDHGLRRAAPDQPAADRDRPAHRGAAAGHQRQPLHPPRGRRGPRRPAVRADRVADRRPEPVQVRGRRALPEVGGRDAPPVPRAARGVRQHAAGSPSGPTSRSSSASRSCPSSPCPRASRDARAAYLRHLTFDGAPSSATAAPVPAEVVERLDYELGVIADMGFSAYFLVVWDLIRYARDAGHPGGPGPGLGGRAAAWPTACASSTSTRSATTCSSSASSTRAASRCPTSTWTSTSATAAR